MKSLKIKPILMLAGGFGSRLKSVVSDVPKPLAPVCGRPFIIHLIENLIYQAWKKGVKSLYYCRSLSIQRAERDETKFPVAVEAPVETNDYEECLSCQ